MRNGILALMVAFTFAGAGLMACGDDATPTPPVGGTGGTGGTDGPAGSGGTVGGTSDGSAGPDATAGTDGGGDNCFQGTPTTNDQFMNACPAMGVFKVDKVVTLPGGLKVGATLPPLQ